MLLLPIAKFILILVLAAIAGWCFRFGGSSHGIRCIREIGVGLTEILGLLSYFGFSWWLLLIMGTTFAETTYFKKKGTEAKWYHWLLCGLCYSIICLPLVITGLIPLKGFLIRLLILTPIITLWRTFQGDVQWSEGGAGAWQILTLPILLIGKKL